MSLEEIQKRIEKEARAEADRIKGEGSSAAQAVLDEARKFGDMVPIVVWPDGRVEQGFEGHLGCFI